MGAFTWLKIEQKPSTIRSKHGASKRPRGKRLMESTPNVGDNDKQGGSEGAHIFGGESVYRLIGLAEGSLRSRSGGRSCMKR